MDAGAVTASATSSSSTPLSAAQTVFVTHSVQHGADSYPAQLKPLQRVDVTPLSQPEQYNIELPKYITDGLDENIRLKSIRFVAFVLTFMCSDSVFTGSHYARPNFVSVVQGDQNTTFNFLDWKNGDLSDSDLFRLKNYQEARVVKYLIGNRQIPGEDVSTASMCLSVFVKTGSLYVNWNPDEEHGVVLKETSRQKLEDGQIKRGWGSMKFW
jgi:hypothetical protein